MCCANCGAPCVEGDTFCTGCGTALKQNFLLAPLRHPLFLALCILISCGCGLAFISGEFSVISILLTIFFWLTYASAKKGVVSQTHLRSISGTFFASYVVNFVLFGVIALAGVLIFISLLLLGTGSWAASFLEIETDLQKLQDVLAGGVAGMTFISVIAIVLLIVFLVIAAVGIILNILGYRKIHKFAQSLYLNVYSENPILYKPGTVSGWMIAFGIFFGLSALSNLGDDLWLFLENGAYSAAFFVGNAWVRKHFCQTPN